MDSRLALAAGLVALAVLLFAWGSLPDRCRRCGLFLEAYSAKKSSCRRCDR